MALRGRYVECIGLCIVDRVLDWVHHAAGADERYEGIEMHIGGVVGVYLVQGALFLKSLL
jgi:hypothetical protein